MSILDVANIESQTAGSPPTIKDSGGTEIGQFCRAWVLFVGTGTVSITDSFNVTSITDNGSGNYAVNFTNAMPNATYAVSVTSSESASEGFTLNSGNTTTACSARSRISSGASTDSPLMSAVVFAS